MQYAQNFVDKLSLQIVKLNFVKVISLEKDQGAWG